MADQVQTLDSRHPQTAAWLYLVGSFLVFCAILTAGIYMAWRYYRDATTTLASQVVINAATGVYQRPKGSIKPVRPETMCSDLNKFCFNLQEGDSVTADPAAGYGPVASLVLPDSSQLDMFSHPNGVELTLERYRTSRWTALQQDVIFRQNSGYVRYNIADGQSFQKVNYSVLVGDVVMQLTPGGSYSIDVFRDADGKIQPRIVGEAPMLAQIAAREGSATISIQGQQMAIRPGEKVGIDPDGKIGEPDDAQWELLADGDFRRYTSDEYNQLGGTDTWGTYSGSLIAMPPSELVGYVQVMEECPPDRGNVCSPSEVAPVVRFFRQGNQTRPFSTGISQTLDLDVSEYTESLRLTGWIRVINQSVENAGERGSECPVMIFLRYSTSSPDNRLEYVRCIYTGSDNAPKDPSVQYERVALKAWKRLDIELRAPGTLDSAWYLQDIRIEARGHDYLSEVTDLSLTGR